MLNTRINKKIMIFKFITVILFLIIFIKLVDIQLIKHKDYQKELMSQKKEVYSLTSPRGRIYDRNGVLLVDNEPIKIIRYSKLDNTKSEEKEISIKLAEILNLDSEQILKKMNNGYYYDIKTLKEDVTDQEYTLIEELSLKGVFGEIGWKRIYKNASFRKILGNISLVPVEKKDYYLKNGYSLNDIVGVSYIEEVYDDILKGKKSKYIYDGDSYKLVEEGTRGNDIYLTIDIKLQEEIEKILEEQIKRAKGEKNTKYYNHSYVIISNPNNGEILAMSGKQLIDSQFYDYTPNILTSTVTMGSSIKGASNIVGYKTGTLTIGERRQDYCIKILATEPKCSWRALGILDDLTALKYSSNSYQFQTAIKVGQGNYNYNKKLFLEETALDKYREIFGQFGLGVKTEIDFFESSGYKGSKKNAGLILDFAIGQYDTYTPMQLSQYINTIANGGKRIKPLILKGYYDNGKYINVEPLVLNRIDVADTYMKRVQLGFKMVMDSNGTGYNYISSQYKPAGKTGTSTSYIDQNLDGVVETATTTNTFVGYAPYDKPIVTFTVISPNVKPANSVSSYKTNVNKKISYEVARKFFEIYK